MVSTALALGLMLTTLAISAVVGLWYARGRVHSIDDFITARGSADEKRLTATLVASVMGVWILFSAPEAGAGFGIAAVAGYAIGEAIPMLVYSRIGPRVRELIPEGHSLTEYVYARYGGTMYGFVLFVSALYMFIFLAAELTGISGALSLIAGVPQWQTAILIGGIVLVYTGYGGVTASIGTDTLQALVVIPLLVLSFGAIVVSLGGIGPIHRGVATANPNLLDPGFLSGIRFGIALSFAILGAELINQTWWQRIYAGENDKVVRQSFRNASLMNGAMVFVAALFGIIAVGNADVVTDITSASYNADVALFVLLEGAFPEWVVIGVTLLALLLVISSVDTLFNALSSLVTVDLSRVVGSDDQRLRLGARIFTIVVAIAAIYVSLRAQSVLRLFFLADLLGAAVAFPLVYGLYSESLTGTGALASSVAGLAVGLAYFPDLRGFITAVPVVGDMLPAADPLYLISFAGAFCVSTALTFLAAWISRAAFDFDQLAENVQNIDTDQSEAAD